jgi:hypothetical protein
MFHAKVMRFEGAILKNEVAVWGGWVTVMPPAAAVWGIMSWEVEEEEGAWLAIVEEGRREGRRRRWERRTTGWMASSLSAT